MRILRADAMGFCFGVRDALELAHRLKNPGEVTVHGELVHNETVLTGLKSTGFEVVDESDREQLRERPYVLVTAHGISDKERTRLVTAGKKLIDTTCPLVAKVHESARQLHDDGWFVLVIGKPGHVEVRGIVEDLERCDIVQRPEDVKSYAAPKLGIVCQTTTAERDVDAIRAAIREKNPAAKITFVDTVCKPTKDRQAALESLLRLVDAMVVVGGANSNNTRRLVARSRERGIPVCHVQGADDLDPSWFEGVETVGLTAGTSTPDSTIDAVHAALTVTPRRRRSPRAPSELREVSAACVPQRR